jgi:hypothetical protein
VVDLKHTLVFDDYTIPQLQQFSHNFGDVVPRITKTPGADGGYDAYGDEPAARETGNVQVSFVLIGTDAADMKTKRDAVYKLYSKGVKQLKWTAGASGTEQFCYARVNNIRMNIRPSGNTDYWQSVTINFQVRDPRWLRTDSTVNQACSGASTTFTVNNAGTGFAVPKITVACGAAQSVTTVTVQRLDGATILDQVKYDAAIGNSESLVIDVNDLSVELDSVDAYSSDFSFYYGRWFLLAPGDNSIKVILDASGAATVTFEFAPAFL